MFRKQQKISPQQKSQNQKLLEEGMKVENIECVKHSHY